MIIRNILCMIFILLAFDPAVAQEAIPPATQNNTDNNSIQLYVKLAGIAVTAIATCVGLPIVLLNYRKTKAEIAKIELETEKLRQGINPEATENPLLESRETIPNIPSSVMHLSGRGHMAVLLLIIDFVFAWIVFELASRAIGMINIYPFNTLAMFFIASLLFLPIAKQALRLRAALSMTGLAVSSENSLNQARMIAMVVYFGISISSIVFGVILLYVERGNTAVNYFGVAFLIVGGVLLLLSIVVRRKVNSYFIEFLSD